MRYGFVKMFFFFLVPFSIVFGNVLNVPSEYSTIQSAIYAAEEGDTVLVSEGIYFENIRFMGKNIVVASQFIMDGNVDRIQNTIIDGSQPTHPDTGSCVLIISGEDSTTILQGFTLTGGTGTKWIDEHGAGKYREGGGILVTNSSPTIRNNIIKLNEAIDKTGCISAGGGAMRIGDGNPYILNNLIMENKGRYGAGIVLNYSEGVVKNNIIVKNTGGGDYGGGGIWTLASGTTIIENNTIAHNSVSGGAPPKGKGGGIFVWGTTINAKNNIIYGNIQTGGDQIYLYSGGTANITFSNVEGGFTGDGNIDIDPLFDMFNYYIGENSECIDAGNPDEIYNDVDDPENPGFALLPSLGSVRNDLGAYGGPGTTNFPEFLTITDLKDKGNINPVEFELYQNYPNPFNPTTRIKYEVGSSQFVTLKVYDTLGREIAALINEEKTPGVYEVEWNASELASGVYFYKLKAGNFSKTNKLLLMK